MTYGAGEMVEGRKRYLMTDTLGLLRVVVISIVSVHDRDTAMGIVDLAMVKAPGIQAAFVDAGYACPRHRSQERPCRAGGAASWQP